MENYIIYPKQLRRQIIPVDKNKCFFLMPFNREFDIIYGTIKGKLNDLGYICNRADEIAGSTPIISKILTEIMRSQYIIVDLTNSNPNVFYELGIAHTLKEARNVLLIKQKNYKVPFDISHLTYIEYDPNNLLLLVSTILNFLGNGRRKNEFYDALNQHHIISFIDENENDFIEYLQENLQEDLEIISKILLGEYTELENSIICKAINKFLSLLEELLFNVKFNLFDKLIDILYEIFVSMPEHDYIRKTINLLFNEFFERYNISDEKIREYKTKLAIKLAKSEKYIDYALTWIVSYFSRSKSTTIDLNRYNIENFLLTSNSSRVDEAIINSLRNNDCYIREHMSDIIGEKKLCSAENLLCIQLTNENNYFTAQSMMEALGKIKAKKGINVIEKWVKKNEAEILSTKQLFVLKHALKAITVLDDSTDLKHLSAFQDKFGKILADYYIV